MAWNGMAVFVFLGLVSLINIIHSHAYEDNSNVGHHFFSSYRDRMVRIESIKASFLSKNGISFPPSPSPSPSPTLASPPTMSPSPRVYQVTAYGADPTGKMDSTDAILNAISDAFRAPDEGRVLMPGIRDLGGAQVHLQGGAYKISRPLRLPASGGGNFMTVCNGGSEVAFPLWSPAHTAKRIFENPILRCVLGFGHTYLDGGDVCTSIMDIRSAMGVMDGFWVLAQS